MQWTWRTLNPCTLHVQCSLDCAGDHVYIIFRSHNPFRKCIPCINKKKSLHWQNCTKADQLLITTFFFLWHSTANSSVSPQVTLNNKVVLRGPQLLFLLRHFPKLVDVSLASSLGADVIDDATTHRLFSLMSGTFPFLRRLTLSGWVFSLDNCEKVSQLLCLCLFICFYFILISLPAQLLRSLSYTSLAYVSL